MLRHISIVILGLVLVVLPIRSTVQAQTSTLPSTRSDNDLTDPGNAGDIFSDDFDTDLTDPDSDTLAEEGETTATSDATTDTTTSTSTSTTSTPTTTTTTTVSDTQTGPMTVIIYWLALAGSFGILQTILVMYRRRQAE